MLLIFQKKEKKKRKVVTPENTKSKVWAAKDIPLELEEFCRIDCL
jgi:predicted transcriptional regulator